jgi:aminoglycoside phosphotransferase (APT) family kinase protein
MELPEPGPLIGTGKQANVFAAGEAVVKLSARPGGKRAAFHEAAVLARIESLDLPAPRVRGVVCHEGHWGIVMDRVDGPAFGERMRAAPETVPAHLLALARLHEEVHRREGAGLPDLVASLRAAIGRAPVLSDGLRRRLREGLAARPVGDRLCHGDFHPYNVMGALDTPVLIDWMDARCGAPEADLCRSWLLIDTVDPGLAEGYVGAYLDVSAVERGEVFAWLPYVAAARLAEDVPEEHERLLAMAERV